MTSTRQTGGGPSSGDLWGGLAAMLVALPSAIGFGVLIYTAIAPEYAGQGALAGMLGAAALGIVAPLVSRNGGFISAPCAPAAAVMAGLATQFVESGAFTPERIILLLAVTALLSSAFQTLYGLVRAGSLIKFIPYQVVSGYLSGVAVVIALGQLPKLLGLPKGMSIGRALISPGLWNGVGVTVGLATIAVMVTAPRITRKVPAAILGLLAGIAAYFMLALFNHDLLRLDGNPLVIGPINTSVSMLATLDARVTSLVTVRLADIELILVSALTLSVLLSVDTLKTGVVLDALARSRHDSSRELVGQGLANAAAYFVGGTPGAGMLGATLVNFTSGGRTLWSGVAEGGFVVLTLVLLGGLIAWVPIGALAGVLLVVAWRMFDHSMFRLARERSTRVDFMVIATVTLVAQFELIAASVVGIGLSILLFIRDQVHTSVIVSKIDLRGSHSKRRRLVAAAEILARHGDEAVVVQLQGNLFFGTTDQLFSELEPDLAKRRFVLVDLRRVYSMDFTAAHLFEQMRERLHERNGELLFSGIPSSVPTRQDIARYMEQQGLASSRDGIRIFDTRDSALEWMEDHILEAAGWAGDQKEEALAVGEIEIFSQLDGATIDALRSAVRSISIEPGGRIFSQGDTGDEIYFVRRGRVQALLPLEGGKRHHLATFCQGDFFGELAFLDRESRSADTEASTPCDLYALSRERFDALVTHNPELGGRVFEQLAYAISKRLRSADTELRLLEER